MKTTTRQKINMLRGMFTGDIARTGPLFVDIDLTTRCNLRCLGCPYHSGYLKKPAPTTPTGPDLKDMPLEFLRRLSAELREMGTRTLVLQGEGEPFLHPGILDIIRELKADGFHLTLITNGTLLYKEAVEALVDARLDTLTISLWAATPQEYELNYPGTDPGNFTKAVNGLKLLSEVKAERKSALPVVYLHNVINRNNYRSVEEMAELARRTGCDFIAYAPFQTLFGVLDRFSLSADEVRRTVQALERTKERLRTLSMGHNIDKVLLRYRVGSSVWEKLPCYAAWYHFRVKVDGTVIPCNRCDTVVIGNLQNETTEEVWNSPAAREFRKKTSTLKGLESMGGSCDCSYCCHIAHNMRIHRIFRWLSPLRLGLRGRGGNELAPPGPTG